MYKTFMNLLLCTKTYWTRIVNLSYFLSDYKKCMKYSLGYPINTREKHTAQIMLLMHSLEKGLSMPDKKQGFGKEKSLKLSQMISKYNQKYGRCETTDTAINILDAYLKCEFSTQDTPTRNTISRLITENRSVLIEGRGGTRSIEKPSFDLSFMQILDFYSQRHSIRQYSRKPISPEEIKKAQMIAASTPTACNRQTSRLYSFRDKETIYRLLDNQLGGQGWCEDADTLFVITSDRSYFNGNYERAQPYVDGGLFAMNFVMGLHAQKIASCFKMFIKSPKREKKFKAIAGISDTEIPIVLILAGHYLDEPVLSPISHKQTQQK